MSGSPYLDKPARRLIEYRDELLRRFGALPLAHPGRARLALYIRQVEAAIDRVSLE